VYNISGGVWDEAGKHGTGVANNRESLLRSESQTKQTNQQTNKQKNK